MLALVLIALTGCATSHTASKAPETSSAIPQELAQMPQSSEAYKSHYAIAEVVPTYITMDGTSVDATIEATSVPGRFLFTGRMEWMIDGRSLNWEVGARHTVKGKIMIMGYTIVSDPNNRLVFQLVRGKGYVYEKGRGMVITPSGERVFLQSN